MCWWLFYIVKKCTLYLYVALISILRCFICLWQWWQSLNNRQRFTLGWNNSSKPVMNVCYNFPTHLFNLLLYLILWSCSFSQYYKLHVLQWRSSPLNFGSKIPKKIPSSILLTYCRYHKDGCGVVSKSSLCKAKACAMTFTATE